MDRATGQRAYEPRGLVRAVSRSRRSVVVDDAVWDAARAFVAAHPDYAGVGELVEDALSSHLLGPGGLRRLKAVRRTQVAALERTVARLSQALEEQRRALAAVRPPAGSRR